jgi:hypothetical protein
MPVEHTPLDCATYVIQALVLLANGLLLILGRYIRPPYYPSQIRLLLSIVLSMLTLISFSCSCIITSNMSIPTPLTRSQWISMNAVGNTFALMILNFLILKPQTAKRSPSFRTSPYIWSGTSRRRALSRHRVERSAIHAQSYAPRNAESKSNGLRC